MINTKILLVILIITFLSTVKAGCCGDFDTDCCGWCTDLNIECHYAGVSSDGKINCNKCNYDLKGCGYRGYQC